MSKIKIGAQVTAKVRPTKVTVSGTFQGYRLEDQEDPTSICGTVLHVKDGMQHLDYVYVDSIKVCESEDEKIRKAIIRLLQNGGYMEPQDKEKAFAWLEKQKEQPGTDMKSPFTGGKVTILSREEEVTFRGENVKILRKYYRCEDTGREFTDSKLDDDMMWAAFRAYCEKKGMTSFTDIILKQEQPEVDLEKEMDKFYGIYRDKTGKAYDVEDNEPCFDWKEGEFFESDMRIVRHFYELGLNARK
jgi:hypothetical protein